MARKMKSPVITGIQRGAGGKADWLMSTGGLVNAAERRASRGDRNAAVINWAIHCESITDSTVRAIVPVMKGQSSRPYQNFEDLRAALNDCAPDLVTHLIAVNTTPASRITPVAPATSFNLE